MNGNGLSMNAGKLPVHSAAFVSFESSLEEWTSWREMKNAFGTFALDNKKYFMLKTKQSWKQICFHVAKYEKPFELLAEPALKCKHCEFLLRLLFVWTMEREFERISSGFRFYGDAFRSFHCIFEPLVHARLVTNQSFNVQRRAIVFLKKHNIEPRHLKLKPICSS